MAPIQFSETPSSKQQDNLLYKIFSHRYKVVATNISRNKKKIIKIFTNLWQKEKLKIELIYPKIQKENCSILPSNIMSKKVAIMQYLRKAFDIFNFAVTLKIKQKKIIRAKQKGREYNIMFTLFSINPIPNNGLFFIVNPR